MTYKNVFAKEIWIDKMPLIKKENKDARVTKKQFVMWKNKKNDVKNTPRENTTKNKYFLEKGKQLKNADNGKTGAIRSGLARTPRSVRLWVVLSQSII